jgi:hypothetical protein
MMQNHRTIKKDLCDPLGSQVDIDNEERASFGPIDPNQDEGSNGS